LKAAADQGSIEADIECSSFFLRGDGIRKDVGECEKYLRLAVDEGNVTGQMGLEIYLMSGILGRFGFEESRKLFDQASRFHRLTVILRDSLSNFDCELMNPSDFSWSGHIGCSISPYNLNGRALPAHLIHRSG
jgi:TPR repeat protein